MIRAFFPLTAGARECEQFTSHRGLNFAGELIPQSWGFKPMAEIHEVRAPADARPHRRWPIWQMVLAYVIMTALAIAAILLIDAKVHT